MRAGLSRALLVIAAAAAALQLGVGTAAAVPGPPHHIAVPKGIGAGRVLVLRPHRVDLFTGGHFVRSVYLDGTHATLIGLTDAIHDASFLARSASGGNLRVTAGLIQRPGTSLVVGGAGQRTVELRADPVSPAVLTGTGANLSFRGVTVTGTGPAAPAGRPYVSYGGGSVISVSSSNFAQLGRPGQHPHAALGVGRGSTLTASNVSFSRNAVGLSATNSAVVRLDSVTAVRSAADGIVLRNAGLVQAGAISVVANGGNGLVIAGAGTHLSITGAVTATDNQRSGIRATSAVQATIQGARTHHNGIAGIEVRDSGVSSVLGLVSTSEPVALRIDSGAKLTADNINAAGDRVGIHATARSRNVTLHSIVVSGATTGVRIDGADVVADTLTVSGSEMGLQVTPSAQNVSVTKLTVTRPVASSRATVGAVLAGDTTRLTDTHIDGVDFGLRITGPLTTIKGGTVSAADTVVRVNGQGDGTTLSGMKVSGGAFGISVSDPATLTLNNDQITGSSRTALHTRGSRTTTITASTLTSAGTAIDGHGPVRVAGSTVDAAIGAHIAAGVVARFTDSRLNGSNTGIHVVDGGQVSVADSHVTGHTPISGKATVLGLSFIGPLPLHWLGFFGLALVLVALLLLALSRLRQEERERLAFAPAHVTNYA